MDNKLIVWRLVSGALLIVLAVFSFICSIIVANVEIVTGKNINAVIGAYSLVAIYSLIVGIFFCVSYKKQSKKWIEYIIVITTIFLFFLLPSIQHYRNATYLIIFRWALLIFVGVGFQAKKKLEKIRNAHNSLENEMKKQ